MRVVTYIDRIGPRLCPRCESEFCDYHRRMALGYMEPSPFVSHVRVERDRGRDITIFVRKEPA